MTYDVRVWVKQMATGKVIESASNIVKQALAQGRIEAHDQVATTPDGPWVPATSLDDLIPPPPLAISGNEPPSPNRSAATPTWILLVIGAMGTALLTAVLLRLVPSGGANPRPHTPPTTTTAPDASGPPQRTVAAIEKESPETDDWTAIQSQCEVPEVDVALLERRLLTFRKSYPESQHQNECLLLLFQTSMITNLEQTDLVLSLLDREVYRPLLERADGDRAAARKTLADDLPTKSAGIAKAFTKRSLGDAFITRLLDLLAEEATRARECETHFIQFVMRSSDFYNKTNSRLAELAASEMLESAKDLERRSLLDPNNTPFNSSSKAVLAWPFFLLRIGRGEKDSVSYAMTPAIAPVTLDPATRATLSFCIETGSVGVEDGVNRFGGPASRLVSNQTTNVVYSRHQQSVWEKWKPMWDGPTARGLDDKTTWFWVMAEAGAPLTIDELSQMLKAKGGPARAEIRLFAPITEQPDRLTSLTRIQGQPNEFRFFSENTKTFRVDIGHGRFREVFARLKEGMKGKVALTSDCEQMNAAMAATEPTGPKSLPPVGQRAPENGGTGPPNARKHEVLFDLRREDRQMIKASHNARIFEERDGTSYWGPTVPGKLAEIIYEIPIPGRLDGITSAVSVVAYNGNHESKTVFDPGCGATLEVSVDGQQWWEVQRSVAGEHRADRDINTAPGLRGATTIYLRARLKVTTASRGDIRYAQFLRGNPGKGEIPKIECLIE